MKQAGETNDAARTVVVAVHGVGDQTRFETLRPLVHRALVRAKRPRKVSIGDLHSQIHALHATAVFAELPGLAFAEVFWADVGRDNEKYVLGRIDDWVDDVVERVHACEATGSPHDPTSAVRLGLVRRVLADMGKAIALVRLANRGLASAGIGSIDFERISSAFLADVQMFAEFAFVRREVMARFHTVMRQIAEESAPEARIHICAHSLGSVVAFLGILEAAARHEEWVSRTSSLLTIGSPIDKFITLWPEMFDDVRRAAPLWGPVEPIAWMNYADLGDPVGYEIDSAREEVAAWAPTLFRFVNTGDAEVFDRYYVPGLAHLAYWKDQALFDHWFDAHVLPSTSESPAPPPSTRKLSTVSAYAISFGVLLVVVVASAHFFASVINGVSQIGAAVEPGASGATLSLSLRQVLETALYLFGFAALSGASRTSWSFGRFGVGVVATAVAATLIGLDRDFALATSTYVSALAVTIAIALLQNLLDRNVTVSGARRPLQWIFMLAPILLLFAFETNGFDAQAIFGFLVPLGTAIVLWVLAIVLFDLVTVWFEYVRNGRHLEHLRKAMRRARMAAKRP